MSGPGAVVADLGVGVLNGSCDDVADTRMCQAPIFGYGTLALIGVATAFVALITYPYDPDDGKVGN